MLHAECRWGKFNISSVEEFQRSVRQELGMILENKVDQKFKLEKKRLKNKMVYHTVPNNSFGFWADLHLDGHV